MSDHERIWLENPNQPFGHTGRQWCQDKVWPECSDDLEPVEYVRADIFAASEARVKVLEAALERSREGWANVVELKILAPQHMFTAGLLEQEARAALKGEKP